MAIKPTSTSAYLTILNDIQVACDTSQWATALDLVQHAGLEVQGMMFDHRPQLAKFMGE